MFKYAITPFYYTEFGLKEVFLLIDGKENLMKE